eukprot:830869-Pleurochrysis_carterae.AAC.1
MPLMTDAGTQLLPSTTRWHGTASVSHADRTAGVQQAAEECRRRHHHRSRQRRARNVARET